MLVAFCDAMGLDKVDVVANDSGSAIAQIFAARHPERIASLTLTNGDIHDNWPPKQAEPLIKLAKEGRPRSGRSAHAGRPGLCPGELCQRLRASGLAVAGGF